MRSIAGLLPSGSGKLHCLEGLVLWVSPGSLAACCARGGAGVPRAVQFLGCRQSGLSLSEAVQGPATRGWSEPGAVWGALQGTVPALFPPPSHQGPPFTARRVTHSPLR